MAWCPKIVCPDFSPLNWPPAGSRCLMWKAECGPKRGPLLVVLLGERPGLLSISVVPGA